MSDAFQTLSDGLAGAVTAAGPAIVRVEARRHTPGSGILWSAATRRPTWLCYKSATRPARPCPAPPRRK